MVAGGGVISLVDAVEGGNVSMVKQLLDNKAASLEQRDKNGQTALILAAEKGHIDIIQELLRRGANVNAQDEDGWTSLIAACKEGHYEVVKELLDNGAKVQLPDMGGWTPLVWASYKGHTTVVRELLGQGADPNERGQHGMTALIWASGRGHVGVVNELVNVGAKVDAADKYGTTALVWACRKGHIEVVTSLLEKGANVDATGSRGWTPLIMAAKGGYGEVVDKLLTRTPNVNAVDQDGCSALTWAAKQGHEEVVRKLLSKGAYLNITDKEGETVLICAARDGHLEVVRALLYKYADVDVTDVDGRTALHNAAEKGHLDIVKELLDAGASTEIPNKDGETPLLRATMKKHTEIVSLLLDKNANVFVADKRGDTALHIAVRGRYKRICELLLRNPKDSRLLYRPNKLGETPYNIDRTHKHSVLGQIFGTGATSTGSRKCSDEIMGYDLYTSALADVLCEPSLNLPLTVGLYARWGSGKSFLLKSLQDEMKEFAHQDIDPPFQFSWFLFMFSLLLSTIVGIILWSSVNTVVGVSIGVTIFILCYILFCCAYFSSKKWEERGNSCSIGDYVARGLSSFRLLSQLMFCIPPSPNAMKPALPVRFLFVDFSRLASSGSEAASLVGMIETLCDVIEGEFGFFITRLYRVFRVVSTDYEEVMRPKTRWKQCCCCIPSFVVFLFVIFCGLVGIILYKSHGTDGNSLVTALEITTASIVGVAILAHFPTMCSVLYSLIFSQKKRLSVVATQLGLKEEGFIHALKQEVELLTDLVNCVDGFTHHQTRIVLTVDGLDSCEQGKVLQLLDSVNLLFTDPETPFITAMALDPRVIVRAIDQSFSSILRESHISAYDYLKSIIQLPFYLPEPRAKYNGVLPNSVTCLLEEIDENDHYTEGLEWDTEHEDGEVRPGPETPRDFQSCNGRLPGSQSRQEYEMYTPYNGGEPHEKDPCLVHGQYRHYDHELDFEERRKLSADLAQILSENENINPLGIKRLMNVISLTGRLLRAKSIDYTWKRLAAWSSLVDGWPYKTSWLVLLVEDGNTQLPDNMPLKNLYEATLSAMPIINEVDCVVDGDAVQFETFLSSHQPLMNVGDIRRFISCTIHLDPSIRRQMVEWIQSSMQSKVDAARVTGCKNSPTREDQHPDLPRLSVEDVCKQLSEIDGLDAKMLSTYQAIITENNVNGKVLAACDLTELSQVMNMTFGDWQLFRAWILCGRQQEHSLHSGWDVFGLSSAPTTWASMSQCGHELCWQGGCGDQNCQHAHTDYTSGDGGDMIPYVHHQQPPQPHQYQGTVAQQTDELLPEIMVHPPSTPSLAEHDEVTTGQRYLRNEDDDNLEKADSEFEDDELPPPIDLDEAEINDRLEFENELPDPQLVPEHNGPVSGDFDLPPPLEIPDDMIELSGDGLDPIPPAPAEYRGNSPELINDGGREPMENHRIKRTRPFPKMDSTDSTSSYESSANSESQRPTPILFTVSRSKTPSVTSAVASRRAIIEPPRTGIGVVDPPPYAEIVHQKNRKSDSAKNLSKSDAQNRNYKEWNHSNPPVRPAFTRSDTAPVFKRSDSSATRHLTRQQAMGDYSEAESEPLMDHEDRRRPRNSPKRPKSAASLHHNLPTPLSQVLVKSDDPIWIPLGEKNDLNFSHHYQMNGPHDPSEDTPLISATTTPKRAPMRRTKSTETNV